MIFYWQHAACPILIFIANIFNEVVSNKVQVRTRAFELSRFTEQLLLIAKEVLELLQHGCFSKLFFQTPIIYTVCCLWRWNFLEEIWTFGSSEAILEVKHVELDFMVLNCNCTIKLYKFKQVSYPIKTLVSSAVKWRKW